MLSAGDSVCITGEIGIGKTFLGQIVSTRLKCAYAAYRGDNTKCLQGIAKDLDIDLEREIYKETFNDDFETRGRKSRKKESEPKIKTLTAKELKQEIAENIGNTILICDRFHRWPASLKGWIDDLYENGATLLLLGNHRELEDLSYKIPRIQLAPLEEKQIREIIIDDVKNLGLKITTNELSEMAGRAGGNPLIAKRFVKELKQGVANTNIQDGNNYRDITPFLMAIFGLVGAIRFIGMATGNIQLKVLGGLAITLFFSLKSLRGLFSRGSKK